MYLGLWFLLVYVVFIIDYSRMVLLDLFKKKKKSVRIVRYGTFNNTYMD